MSLLLLSLLAVDTATVQLQTTAASLTIAAAQALDPPEVRVLFRANDTEGHAVWGLEAFDCAVYEGGSPAEVLSFRPINEPGSVRLAVTLDFSSSMGYDSLQLAAMGISDLSGLSQYPPGYVTPLVHAKAGLKQFLTRQAEDVEVIVFNHEVHNLAEHTSSRDTMEMILNGLYPSGGTAFFDAVAVGISALLDDTDTDEVQAVVALTDGVDHDSTTPLDTCIARAQAAMIPVFTIGLGGADRTVLQQLSDQTGGQTFFTNDPAQLTAVYDSIQQALQSYYELTYRSESVLALGDSLPQIVLHFPQFNLADDFPATGDTPQAILDALKPEAPRSFPWAAGALAAAAVAGGLAFAYRRRRTVLRIDRMYPNPATGPVTLEFTGCASRIHVFDLGGREQLSAAVADASPLTLDVHALPSGVYVVRLEGPGGADSERLVIR